MYILSKFEKSSEIKFAFKITIGIILIKMKIGYARVSTKDQKLEMQTEALLKAGCEKIYKETQSAVKERPEL